MINPHTQTGKDLAHVAEHLAVWPMNTDFVHVKSGVIHMIEGGSSLAVSYISREQWAAAKTLHQYWFPEKQPKPEGYCDVCGDTHCIHELYPGICAEYDGGMVSLDLAKAIYNGDFRPEKAEGSGMKNSDQVKHWGVAEDEFLAPEIGIVESFLGHSFSTPEEDEAFDAIAKKQQGCSVCGCKSNQIENERLRAQIQSLRDYCDRLLVGDLKR